MDADTDSIDIILMAFAIHMTEWGKRIVIGTVVLVVYMLLRIEWGFEPYLTLFTGILIGICLTGVLVWWRDRHW